MRRLCVAANARRRGHDRCLHHRHRQMLWLADAGVSCSGAVLLRRRLLVCLATDPLPPLVAGEHTHAWAPEFGGRIVCRPRKKNELALSIEMGCTCSTASVPYLFHENQTPRSNSINFIPSEPSFCPQILEPRHTPPTMHGLQQHRRIIRSTIPPMGIRSPPVSQEAAMSSSGSHAGPPFIQREVSLENVVPSIPTLSLKRNVPPIT